MTVRAEGTADMMDWAALHARHRGAETWWKSFTTGKSAQRLGGIPHDTYGMTSLSIRQYVLGIYKQLGLREKDITKVQTGGPGMSSLHCWGFLFLDAALCRRRPWFK
jgi:glutamate dehydrogenase